MKFGSLDLNLLVLFDALMRTRSVTQAGEKVGLSQSATSNALQRLREALEDPLFVRTPKGMEPSALALELETPIRAALDQLQKAVETGRLFDPATASRTFRVVMSDIAQMLHMPGVVAMMRKSAPCSRLENVAVSLREAKQAMADGELDMAIGFLPDLGADFRRQSLFSESWVCVVSKAHPRIGSTISSTAYLQETHISLRPAVAIHSTLDALLAAQLGSSVTHRRVGLVVPYSSGIAATVACSDLVLTVPVGLAATMLALADVRLVPLPYDLPKIDLNMQWHERFHRDPGGRWLRDAFARSYKAKEPTPAIVRKRISPGLAGATDP